LDFASVNWHEDGTAELPGCGSADCRGLISCEAIAAVTAPIVAIPTTAADDATLGGDWVAVAVSDGGDCGQRLPHRVAEGGDVRVGRVPLGFQTVWGANFRDAAVIRQDAGLAGSASWCWWCCAARWPALATPPPTGSS
jgi:hypothetical protein